MSKQKTMAQLLEIFRERLDDLVEDDVDKKTHRALRDIDQTLGLIERAVADFKVKFEAIVGD